MERHKSILFLLAAFYFEKKRFSRQFCGYESFRAPFPLRLQKRCAGQVYFFLFSLLRVFRQTELVFHIYSFSILFFIKNLQRGTGKFYAEFLSLFQYPGKIQFNKEGEKRGFYRRSKESGFCRQSGLADLAFLFQTAFRQYCCSESSGYFFFRKEKSCRKILGGSFYLV